MRPMFVVMTGVFGQHGGQVPLADDEYPVGALSAYGAHPALRERVRAGRLRWGPDHFDAGSSEHRVEDGGEFRITVAEQEPQPGRALVEVRQQISALLRLPGAGRM